MSLEILESIKKHISNTLGVELVRTYDGRDGGAFNASIDGNIIRIFISGSFISLLEGSDDITKTLQEFDVLAFIKCNPGRNVSLNFGGLVVDPINS